MEDFILPAGTGPNEYKIIEEGVPNLFFDFEGMGMDNPGFQFEDQWIGRKYKKYNFLWWTGWSYASDPEAGEKSYPALARIIFRNNPGNQQLLCKYHLQILPVHWVGFEKREYAIPVTPQILKLIIEIKFEYFTIFNRYSLNQ